MQVIYGYHVNPNEPDSYAAVSYIADAVGMTPAKMGTTTFDYGSWENAFFMPKPCMLRYDGTVAYYLNPNDYTKKLDGTPSDVGNPDFEGNAMMEWGQIWYKFVGGEQDGEGYFYVSNEDVDESFHCWCNYDSKDNVVPHFYTAIYNSTLHDGKFRSLSGIKLTQKNGVGYTNGYQEITYCKANNTTEDVEWYTDVYADRILINALLVLIGKSLNTQATFGRGVDEGDNSVKTAYTTGDALNNKGLFYGDTVGGKSGVKVFGMENWWGDWAHRTAGCVTLENECKIKLTYGTVDGSTVNGYNPTGNGYITIGTVPTRGFIKKFKYDEYGYIPYETGGSINTYYADYCASNDAAKGYLAVGSMTGGDSSGGAFSFNTGTTYGTSNYLYTAFLSCKPIRNPQNIVLTPYKIHRNNYITVFDSRTPQDQFNTHGLGVLHPTSCTVYETLNGEWTADIEHPIDPDGKWSYIQKFNILKILGQLFVIRTVDDSTINTRGTIKAHAEHIFYVLNDYLLPKGRSFLRPRYAKRYVEIAMQVAKESYFDGATDYEFAYEIPDNLRVSLDFVDKWGTSTPQSLNISELIIGSGMLLDNTNTQIYRDNFFFSIGERKAMTKDDAFEIRFGLNAKGIIRTVDVSTMCTWLRGYTGSGAEFMVSWDEPTTLMFAPHSIRKEIQIQADSMEELSRRTMEEFGKNNAPLESYSIDLYDATNSPDFEEFTNKADYTVGNRGIIIDKIRNSKVEVEVTSTIRDGITGNYINVQFGSRRGYIGGNYQSVIEPVGDVAIESYIQVKDSNNDFCYDSDDNRIVQDITESEVSYYG